MHRAGGGERLDPRSVVAELLKHLPTVLAQPGRRLRNMRFAALEACRTAQQTHPTEFTVIDFDDAVVVQDLRIGQHVVVFIDAPDRCAGGAHAGHALVGVLLCSQRLEDRSQFGAVTRAHRRVAKRGSSAIVGSPKPSHIDSNSSCCGAMIATKPSRVL